ncbi:SDR family oxidoreductase [Sinomicrobium weinanense]|uniref:SDR family oxidoreductase n=1 Tax=Sinomicrobium weinanense TaxID=2842200 RepID=A0A926JTH0_9FLAO|nr:SDR family oxidoreductase [Sinomicrobium weinanense]MBC9797071.1 SDR family oxidoreductase [Sinomicrobium weinanense]MBU3122700.1 SDR family oxidoreductase [Sinomicrobium weinanense]
MKNKTAYITGGSKGIGLGIAEALLKQGMKVAITCRDKNRGETAMQGITNDKDAYLVIESDVKDYNAELAAIQKVTDSWGQLDLVIANAGIGTYAPIDELSPEAWNNTIDTNLTGVFNTVKAAVPELKKSKGYVITIASLAGTNFFAKGAAYNASKFGLVGFSQAIMLDLRPYDVKVTTIMPGSVATYFNGNIPDASDAWKIQPEDIGQIVVDLLNMPARTLPSKVEVRPSKTSLD